MSYLRPELSSTDLFFPDSGHGGQIRDTDGDEVDGYDEGV